MNLERTQALVQYMRSNPRVYLGHFPKEQVISQMCRLFLDMVILHYPEADVCLSVFEEKGMKGLRGWSHFKYPDHEWMQFAAYIQAFSAKGRIGFAWNDIHYNVDFVNGAIANSENGDNPCGRTVLSFTFFPDEKLLGETPISEQDVYTIKCDYYHLFPELNIKVFNADMGQAGIYDIKKWESQYMLLYPIIQTLVSGENFSDRFLTV